ERLREVIAADLFEFADAIGIRAFDPVDERFMELCARPLQHAGVRGIADEDVHEAERLETGHRDLVPDDEPLENEALQGLVDHRPGLGREKVLDRITEELLPDDRGPLEHALLSGGEPVEPRGDQRIYRTRYR